MDLCRFEMSQSLTDPSIHPKSNLRDAWQIQTLILGCLKKRGCSGA